MLDAYFVRCVINDILTTEEYSLAGIVNYTQATEEVIYDLATGKNLSPSLELSQKIIELHRTVRKEIYDKLLKKLILELSDDTEGGVQ